MRSIRNLNSYALGAVLGALVCLASAQASETETRNMTDFDQIVIKGGADLNVTVGGAFKVNVSTRSGDRLADVRTSVEDGVLIVDMKGRRWNREHVALDVTMPAFHGLKVYGATDATISGVAGGDVGIDISGAGDVDIDGACDRLSLDISGASDINAKTFQCKDVSLNISGAGDAEIYASESVDVQVSGVGDVTVYGRPKNVHKKGGFLADITLKD